MRDRHRSKGDDAILRARREFDHPAAVFGAG